VNSDYAAMAPGKRLVGGMPVYLGRGRQIAQTKDFEWRRRPALAWELKDTGCLEAASAPTQNTSMSRTLKIPQPISTYGQNPLQATLIGVANYSR
jgi:hypothetical protein